METSSSYCLPVLVCAALKFKGTFMFCTGTASSWV